MEVRSKYKKTGLKNKYVTFFVAGTVLTLAVLATEITHVTNFYSRAPKVVPKESGNAINYDPPTDEERQAGDEQKATIVKDQGDAQASPPSAIAVVVTSAEQAGEVVGVTASITNMYKDGTCVFTFKRGESTVTKTTTAYRDVSSTICTNPLVPRADFSVAGDWDITVSYTASDGASGQSVPKTIRIE